MTDETGGFKKTGRYDFTKKEEVFFEKFNDIIPSVLYEEGYRATIDYNHFRDKVFLSIENGVSQASVIIEGITKEEGINLIDKLKENRTVADYVYTKNKSVKNQTLENIYKAIERANEGIHLARATARIKRGDNTNLEIDLEEDEALEPIKKDITAKLTNDNDSPFKYIL